MRMPKGPKFNRSGFGTDSSGKYTPPPIGLNRLGSGSVIVSLVVVDCEDSSSLSLSVSFSVASSQSLQFSIYLPSLHGYRPVSSS